MNLRLAYGGGAEVNRKALEPFKKFPRGQRPALLASYVYLQGFRKNLPDWGYRDWVLDSGAFSAHTCGISISLHEYIDVCKRLRDTDSTLAEVFALDVIGDWHASLKNTEAMWKSGIEAIPCYHAGEPWDLLKGLARDYPKIALGGVAKAHNKHKIAFAQQCFARAWPAAIHGFGFGHKEHILALPWHSVDATSWQLGPSAFGRWNTFGRMSVRGNAQNLRSEINFYLEIERQARERWRKEMQVLAAMLPPSPPRPRTLPAAAERSRGEPLAAEPLVIVPCGSAKKPQPAPAGELYTGSYHRQCLRYARSITSDSHILILSAKHGLLPLSEVIAPYDLKMGQPGCVTVEKIRADAQRLDVLGRQAILLGGQEYVARALPVWPEALVPLRGIAGLGLQMQWLAQNRGQVPSSATPQTTS